MQCSGLQIAMWGAKWEVYISPESFKSHQLISWHFFCKGLRLLNFTAMPRRSNYLESLEAAIQLRHKCKPTHRETVFVHEKTRAEETVWQGHVEVFDVTGHKKARTCYAWQNVKFGGVKIFAVLGNNFIDSPKRAVQAA